MNPYDYAILNDRFSYDPESGIVVWKNGHRAGIPAGWFTDSGYFRAEIGVGKKSKREKYFVHRIAWVLHYGSIPEDMVIDHINGIRFDNRIVNLRLASFSENNCNKRSTRIVSKGVWFREKLKKWEVMIRKDRVSHWIGYFPSYESAALAYQMASKQIHGDFSRVI